MAGQFRNIDVLDSIIPMFPALLNPNTPYDWNYTTTAQQGFNGRSIDYRSSFILVCRHTDRLDSPWASARRFHLRQ